MPELTLVEATTLFARRRDAWLAEDVEAYLACFAADLVITPSQVTANRLPVPATVIPNGADIRPRSEPPPLEHYLLYFGAL